jgi:hypothetical protein
VVRKGCCGCGPWEIEDGAWEKSDENGLWVEEMRDAETSGLGEGDRGWSYVLKQC